ncbi:ankyrin repeat-containing domain protein [Coprinopsis sp. MPI-PUGE-AT-0042]|nr:ankyrin repeat-containing domain protein [Coprinopsis sp. MPI-PUGE-AT-0042]
MALIRAARGGNSCIVKLLLVRRGVQVNLVDNGGSSALSEIQVNLFDSNGGSALILTGGKGNEGVVELLLGTGVFDVNAVDLDGSTPIQLAAKAGHEVTVRLLLDVPNIDISIRNPVGGHPATSTAQANGHTKVSSYIDTYSTNVIYASSSLLYTQRATVAPPDLALTNNTSLQEFLNGLVSIL